MRSSFKRLLSVITLSAAMLFGAANASADRYRHRSHGDGAAVGLALLIGAAAVVAANRHDRRHDRYYDQRYYGNGYNNGYRYNNGYGYNGYNRGYRDNGWRNSGRRYRDYGNRGYYDNGRYCPDRNYGRRGW